MEIDANLKDYYDADKECKRLMKNLCKLHTTYLGVIRIKKNLQLETDNVITINAKTYTIITSESMWKSSNKG